MYIDDDIPVLLIFNFGAEKCLIDKDDFFFDGLPANEQMFFSVDIRTIAGSSDVSVLAYQHMPALGRHRQEVQILNKQLRFSSNFHNEIRATLEQTIELFQNELSVA